VVTSPPVAGARCGAASAQNALVKTVKLLALSGRLQDFLVLATRFDIGLEPRLDRLDLLVEVAEIRNQVFNNWHVGQGEDSNIHIVNTISHTTNIIMRK
jgi:hypothetical protein